MLERVCRNGNLLILFVGIQTSTVIMDNSVKIPKTLEIELPYDPATPLLGIYAEETRIEKDNVHCSTVIIAITWK